MNVKDIQQEIHSDVYLPDLQELSSSRSSLIEIKKTKFDLSPIGTDVQPCRKFLAESPDNVNTIVSEGRWSNSTDQYLVSPPRPATVTYTPSPQKPNSSFTNITPVSTIMPDPVELLLPDLDLLLIRPCPNTISSPHPACEFHAMPCKGIASVTRQNQY